MFNNYYQEEATNSYPCYDQKNNYYNDQLHNWHYTSMVPDDSYYADYDREMANAVAEAEYLDYHYQGEYPEEEQYQDEEMNQAGDFYHHNDNYMYFQQNQQEQQQEEYQYENDSLLSLIVGVQSYLEEQESAGAIKGKCDSPLYSLQYKMYTYMRQRAYDMGVQF